jgi:type II secretory pathway component GspD/PulD (secretin)
MTRTITTSYNCNYNWSAHMTSRYRTRWQILSAWLLLGMVNPTIAMQNPFDPAMQVDGIDCHHPQRMDFDIQHADREAVLWDIAHCAQWNVQLNTALKGSISLQAKNLKPSQALAMILDPRTVELQQHGFWWQINSKPNTQHWRPFTLHHIDANTLQKAWQQSQHAIGHSHTPAMPDPLHNQWWLYAGDQQWHALQAWIHIWDQPIPQVAIRATIMEVDAQTMTSLGAMLQSQSTPHHDSTWPNPSAGQFKLGIAKLGMQQLLSATLQAAAQTGHGQMIASPHLITLNHHGASIETGAQIPYTEKTRNGDSSTSFKKAVLKLAVTPHVLDKQQLQLDIVLTQDQVNPLHDQQSPSIQTRSISTQVRLQQGQTLMLGGIDQQHHRNNHQHTPGISTIPLLGRLFRQQQRQQQHQQLLLLITPTLLQNNEHEPPILPMPSLLADH